MGIQLMGIYHELYIARKIIQKMYFYGCNLIKKKKS